MRTLERRLDSPLKEAARRAWRAGDYDTGRRLFENAWVTEPAPVCLVGYAACSVARGDHTVLAYAVDVVLRADEDTEILRDLLDLCLGAGEYELANRVARVLLDRSPADPQAHQVMHPEEVTLPLVE